MFGRSISRSEPQRPQADTSSNSVPDPQDLIPLAKLPYLIPAGRNGQRRSRSSVYRYVKSGRDGVLLKSWQLPDGLYTTLQAWHQFIEALTASSSVRRQQPAMCATPRSDNSRHARVEAEIRRIRSEIRRPKPSSHPQSPTESGQVISSHPLATSQSKQKSAGDSPSYPLKSSVLPQHSARGRQERKHDLKKKVTSLKPAPGGHATPAPEAVE
jgi:hypothetical protein